MRAMDGVPPGANLLRTAATTALKHGSKPLAGAADDFVFEYWIPKTTASGEKREWRWRLRTLKGDIVAPNEGFNRLDDCMRSPRLLRTAVTEAGQCNLTPSDS